MRTGFLRRNPVAVTLLLTHPACLEHEPGAGHPECPQRLQAVLEALEAPRFERLRRLSAPRAERAQLLRVHSQALVDSVFAAAPEHETIRIDADTVMSPGSLEAALRSAGAVCAAVEEVLSGHAENAFCAVRPPGHHATAAEAMGFCLFNNVAVGAAHARAAFGIGRIAIVDFDVHHGNGTQDIFANDANTLYASTHQWPLYPGTGAETERGVGNLVNVALATGSGSRHFREACEYILLPALERFRPELLLISAGFDAHHLDPLAGLNLQADDYAWITRELLGIARHHALGRVVSTLEGGYSLTALRESSAAHVGALLDA